MEGLNTQVLGISTDSIHCHYAYNQYRKFGFPLLSDFSHEISKRYDAYYSERCTAMPNTFLVDRDGVIRYHSVHDLRRGTITVEYGVDAAIPRDLVDRLQLILQACSAPFVPGPGTCPIDWSERKNHGLELDLQQLKDFVEPISG